MSDGSVILDLGAWRAKERSGEGKATYEASFTRKMSTPVFVDLEISTQADEAQSSRVPVSFPEDPYEAIRQACLVETDTESEPFKDPVETDTPESPHTVASPTPLLDSTPPTRHVWDPVDLTRSSAEDPRHQFLPTTFTDTHLPML
ncbi:hypothetical protein Tco_1062227 [Tanacetum coccineum]